MNTQIYQKPTTEIDAKEVFWRLLTQWKAIILTAVVMACIVCGMKHFNDVRAYKLDLQAKEEAKVKSNISTEERIEAIFNSYPAEDVSAARVVIKEKDWVNKQKEYLNNSVFMSTDPANQRKATLVFNLKTDDPELLVALKNSFDVFVSSDEFAEIIKPAIDQHAETQYIVELINREKKYKTVNDSDDDGMFHISIVLTDDSDADGAVSLAIEAIKNYSKEISSDYPHTIKLVESDVSSMCNYRDIDIQKNTLENYDDIERIMKEAESNLTEGQKQIVNAVMSIYSESETPVSEETITDESSEALVAPGWSKKHALLGFILGVVAYCCLYVVILIIKGCIISVDMAERYSNGRLLGEVYCTEKPKGLSKLFYSKLVDKYHYWGKDDKTVQIKKLSDSIITVCRRLDIKQLSVLATSPLNIGEIELMKEITDITAKKGITTTVADCSDDFDETQLIDVLDVVFAIGPQTKINALHAINAACNDLRINNLGCIFMSHH